jgi:hypothetical protein
MPRFANFHLLELTLQIFISPSNPTNATARAIQLLQRKMDTYLSWNKKYPGYGGFMPWVKVANTGLDPTGTSPLFLF